MLTFDIKIGGKILKMKMFDDESPEEIVKTFSASYNIGREKELQLMREVEHYLMEKLKIEYKQV